MQDYDANLENFGPWTVIAGGSEGVGACFAHRLAAKGVNLVLIARKPGPLEETAEEVRKAHGVEVRTISMDLGRLESADEVARACEGLDVGGLIFNAGSAHGLAKFLDHPLDQFLGLMRLNVETPARLANHFGKKMRERGGGAIIFLGSGAGSGGAANIAGYAAAKAYLTTLSEGLWHEFREDGIKLLCLILGLTRTPAMIRAGMKMDGGEFHADDPDDVARTAFERLNDGPVQEMDSIRAHVESMRSMPRRDVVEQLSRSTAALV